MINFSVTFLSYFNDLLSENLAWINYWVNLIGLRFVFLTLLILMNCIGKRSKKNNKDIGYFLYFLAVKHDIAVD